MSTRIHYVYTLCVAGTAEILYVGRSVSPKTRLVTHRRKFELAALEIMSVVGYMTFEAAQRAELCLIRALRPALNRRVASSPARLGRVNTAAHNESIAVALRGRTLTEAHKSKLWVSRSRASADNAFFGRRHSLETKMLLQKRTTEQFADPDKRERHRLACVAATARRRAAGGKFGLANR